MWTKLKYNNIYIANILFLSSREILKYISRVSIDQKEKSVFIFVATRNSRNTLFCLGNMCSHKKWCFKLLFWESYAMWKQISKSPPSCRSQWLDNNNEAHMLKRQSHMKLKQLVRKLKIIASFLSSPCQPLPCCLHVYSLHLLIAHCIHVSLRWPGPPSDWSRKWIC